jgi:hypothetical protein
MIKWLTRIGLAALATKVMAAYASKSDTKSRKRPGKR